MADDEGRRAGGEVILMWCDPSEEPARLGAIAGRYRRAVDGPRHGPVSAHPSGRYRKARAAGPPTVAA